MKYQVFELHPELTRVKKGEVLFESDSLGECCVAASEISKSKEIDTCVWQPIKKSYRDEIRVRPYWLSKDERFEVILKKKPLSTNKNFMTVGKIYTVVGETPACYIVDSDSDHFRVYIAKSRFRKL